MIRFDRDARQAAGEARPVSASGGDRPLPTGRQACLGEHTGYVCKEILRLSDEEIAQLLIDEVLR